ncbi:MAG: phosphonopyruvate decarboxylase [Candidatus Tectomicrobia bacterium]
MAAEPIWTDDMYRILRQWDVTQFSYVPDAGHAVMINRSLEDPEVHSVPLTTEEEGVAMLVGAHLGGARGVVMVQSSGVGNCVNMFSLVQNGQFPMLILVSMRGDFGEGNPWQIPMGQATQPILETCGFICMRAERPEEVAPILQAACTMVYQAGQAVAVLLTQRLIGAKAF